MPLRDRYDVAKNPQLTVGQLTDDLAELRAVTNGRSGPVGLDLVHAAALLRAFGERTRG